MIDTSPGNKEHGLKQWPTALVPTINRHALKSRFSGRHEFPDQGLGMNALLAEWNGHKCTGLIKRQAAYSYPSGTEGNQSDSHCLDKCFEGTLTFQCFLKTITCAPGTSWLANPPSQPQPPFSHAPVRTLEKKLSQISLLLLLFSLKITSLQK